MDQVRHIWKRYVIDSISATSGGEVQLILSSQLRCAAAVRAAWSSLVRLRNGCCSVAPVGAGGVWRRIHWGPLVSTLLTFGQETREARKYLVINARNRKFSLSFMVSSSYQFKYVQGKKGHTNPGCNIFYMGVKKNLRCYLFIGHYFRFELEISELCYENFSCEDNYIYKNTSLFLCWLI